MLPDQAKSFPDHAEFEALLTLQGDGEGEWVRSVAMDPHGLGLRQHISLVRLPPAGFKPRDYHPASDGFSSGYFDPASILGNLTPPSNEYLRNREYFATRTAPLFGPMAAVEAGAALTRQFLFDPMRLNRRAWQHARDPAIPAVSELLEASFQATWGEKIPPASLPAARLVQPSRNWIVLDAIMAALEGEQLHAAVAADLRGALSQGQKALNGRDQDRAAANSRHQAAERVGRYLADPNSIKSRGLPPIPPGAPI